MEELYTERYNLREKTNYTSIINREMYSLLLNVCNKYRINLVNEFPDYCSDFPNVICGVDASLLCKTLKFRIPDLQFDYSETSVVVPFIEEYNQYALLDYIEYIGKNIKDFNRLDFHDFFKHYHIELLDTDKIKLKFQKDINYVFKLTGLLYRLNENSDVERITNIDEQIEVEMPNIVIVDELGLKDLLLESIKLYRNPRPEIHKLATEKIWDAFERLKTIFLSECGGKKQSADKLIEILSKNDEDYITLLNTEFEALTKIGNNYRIRHHETNKKEITDERYYDYFFNRCFAIVVLAIKYVNQNIGMS